MKKSFLFFVSLYFVSITIAQPCTVTVDALKGQYTGKCKKGKADGYGTAVGVDSYTGNFKNGYPEGEGKYVWKNGTWYDGNWKSGLFDGNGTFSKVDDNKPDSATLLTGFWQEGKYIGKYQKPYSFVPLTNGVSDIDGRKIRDNKAEITLYVRSTTAGGSSIYVPLLPKPKLVNVEVVEGRYQQQADNESSTISNKYTFRNVTFPFTAIFTFETSGTNPMPMPRERIKVEIAESSSWYIHVNIDN